MLFLPKSFVYCDHFNSHKIVTFMKKEHEHHHISEKAEIALWAGGFLALIMLLSYLYWYA